MSTNRLPWSALQDLTDDDIDALLAQIATERERRWTLRRTPALVEERRSLLSAHEPG